MRLVCIVILTFLFLNQTLISNDKKGAIQGAVIDESNNSIISDVKLRLGSIIDTNVTTSDLLGNFKFDNLPDGIYTLNLERLGYKKKTVNKISIEEGEIKDFKIFMTPVDIEIERINVTATKTEITLKQTPS